VGLALASGVPGVGEVTEEKFWKGEKGVEEELGDSNGEGGTEEDAS
jgi:hypothetical protein